jgi:ankyrin repeat protein
VYQKQPPQEEEMKFIEIIQDNSESAALKFLREHENLRALKTVRGKNALIIAINLNMIRLIRELLKRPDCNPNLRIFHKTPLAVAIGRKNYECIEILLLDPKVKAFEEDEHGYTHFDWAVRMNNLDIVKLFTKLRPKEVIIKPEITTLSSLSQQTMLFLSDFQETRGMM